MKFLGTPLSPPKLVDASRGELGERCGVMTDVPCQRTDKVPLMLFLFLSSLALFSTHLFIEGGFFSDEFEYFHNYQYTFSVSRMPFVPVVLDLFFKPFGFEYKNDLGLKLFSFGVFLFSFTGLLFFFRHFTDNLTAWLATFLATTFYDFSFYSAKILTDALLVGLLAWFFVFLWRSINNKTVFDVMALMAIAGIGVLTKLSFVLVFPIAVIACWLFEKPRRFFQVVWLLWIIGIFLFWKGGRIAIEGMDRYILFGSTMLFPSLLVTFQERKKLVFLLFGAFAFVNLAAFAFVLPSDAAKYDSIRQSFELSEMHGVVWTDLPYYYGYYSNNSLKVAPLPSSEEFSVQFEGDPPNFVVVSTLNHFTVQENLNLNEKLLEDYRFEKVFDANQLVVFKNVE